MIRKKFSFTAYILSSLLLAFPLLTDARTIDDKKETSVSPSTIKISLSNEKQYLETQEGKIIELPKIVRKTILKSWIVPVLSLSEITTLTNSDEIREMLSLADKLGLTIRNAKDIGLYREAAKWIGTRYKWSGSSEKGVDCSGLTGILLKTVYNKDIDRSSNIIANNLHEELDTKELQPGDLVFFSTLRGKRISHVGVYLGERQFIHASRKGVVVSSLDEAYYARTLRKAGRL